MIIPTSYLDVNCKQFGHVERGRDAFVAVPFWKAEALTSQFPLEWI